MRITITPVNIALSSTTNKIVIYTSGCTVGSSGGGTWGTITGTLSAQTDLQSALNAKVDKITGKGLSTEDYTTIEKQKLAGIEAGAEVNVNADWNASSGDAQILNKPTLATVATSGSYDDLSDTPTIPTNSDFALNGLSDVDISAIGNDKILVWNSTSAKWEIQNKPAGGLDKTFQTLTEAATITFNAATSVNGSVILTASRNAANFANPVVGEDHTWRFVQGGTGSYSITWGDQYKTSGGAMPPLSATVGAVDLYTFKAISAIEFVLVNVIHDYKAIV